MEQRQDGINDTPWGPALSMDEIISNQMQQTKEEYITHLRKRLEKCDRTDEIRTIAGVGSRPQDRARLMGYWSEIMNDVCDELGVGWEFDEDDLRSGRPLVHINLLSKQIDKDDSVPPTTSTSE